MPHLLYQNPSSKYYYVKLVFCNGARGTQKDVLRKEADGVYCLDTIFPHILHNGWFQIGKGSLH